jgi:putative intracellular protease/amidase
MRGCPCSEHGSSSHISVEVPKEYIMARQIVFTSKAAKPSPTSIALLESFYSSGKPIALVCHSPGVLRHVKYQGAPLVKGKHVTGFTNGEEEAVQLTKVVPFLVEDELMRLGAIFEKKANWEPFSITDGRLITGQNPASSTATAHALLTLLAEKVAA